MSLLTNRLRQWRYNKVLPHIKPGQKILDLGCGDGRIIPLLPSGARYIGIDLFPYHRQVKKALDRANLQGKFYQASVEDLLKKNDYLEKNFDRVLLIAVLEHLENPTSVLSQLQIFLKRPSGLIILTTPTKIGGFVHQCLSRLNLVSKHAAHDHHRFLNDQDFLQINNLKLKRLTPFQGGLNQLVVLEPKKSRGN